MPARLPSFGRTEVPQVASSAPYSPTAEDEQPDADRAPAPVLLPPAKASQAASSDAAACCETHQTVVAIARLAQGWRMRFCCSISADLGDLLNVTRSAKSRHAPLPKTHDIPHAHPDSGAHLPLPGMRVQVSGAATDRKSVV